MNVTQLEYFIATVRERSYSLAAKTLYISPQAISKSVSELEKELQVTLIEREGREIVPSTFGEIFYIHATEIVDSFTDLGLLVQHYCEKAPSEDSVNVAMASCGLRGSFVNHIKLDSLDTLYPQAKLTAFYCESSSCLSALDEDVVDAAITIGRAKKGYFNMKLASPAPMVALSNRHPLADRESIALDELGKTRIAQPNDLRFFYRVLTKQLEMHGIDPHYVVVPSFIQEHQGFFDSEDGVMFVTDDPGLERMYTNICIKPLSEKSRFSVPLCLVYKKSNANPALSWLETCLKKAAAKTILNAEKAARTKADTPTLAFQEEGTDALEYKQGA